MKIHTHYTRLRAQLLFILFTPIPLSQVCSKWSVCFELHNRWPSSHIYPFYPHIHSKVFYVLRTLAILFQNLTHDEQWHAIMTDERKDTSTRFRKHTKKHTTSTDHEQIIGIFPYQKISFYDISICHFWCSSFHLWHEMISISWGLFFLYLIRFYLLLSFNLCCLWWIWEDIEWLVSGTQFFLYLIFTVLHIHTP